MHDAANTLNGRYGFAVEYDDGSVVTEREIVWDEVADRPIVALRIQDFEKNESLLELRGYQKFFFVNEAVATRIAGRPGRSTLSAKILGGVNGGVAVECRVDLLGDKPKGSSRVIVSSALAYAPKVFRPGVR